MRTKQCDGVFRLDVTALEPRPEVYLCYDGLGGLTQRPMLRDIVEEISHRGPVPFENFLAAMRKSRSGGDVHIYFHDYVSYGIGGGDATSEFYFGRYMLLWADRERPAYYGEVHEGPPQLILVRPGGIERLELEPLYASAAPA